MRIPVLLFAVACILVPVSDAHALGKIGLTQWEKDKRYDPCLKADNVERCRSRLKQYDTPELVRPAIVDRETFRTYHTRLRRFELNEREHRNTMLRETRRTFRSVGTADDINTERLDYLQSARQEQLDCMLETPGRKRNHCLSQVRQDMRNSSRARRAMSVSQPE
jgi:hypothetical protein